MFARIPLDPPDDDAIPVLHVIVRPGFLTWLVLCDQWLEARSLPAIEMAEAATLYRAGLTIDEVLERAAARKAAPAAAREAAP
jgi:hypothetical protein